MRRVPPLLVAILLTQPVTASVSTPYRSDSVMTVAPGVVHERGTMVTTTGGRQAVYAARVDMSEPVIRVEASISNDQVAGVETTTQQANRKNREGHRAVVAINADTFDASQAPLGIHIQDGELIAYSAKSRPSIGITADHKVLIDVAGVTGSLCRVDGSCFPISRLNGGRTMGEGTGEIVLYTSRYGDSTGTDDSGTEVVLAGLPSTLPVHGSFDATVKRVHTRAGSTRLEANDAVLSGTGIGAKFLDLLADGAKIALSLNVTSGWENVTEAVSGPTLLVRNGAVDVVPYAHGFADIAHARSAIGVTEKGELMMFAVDGRQPGYSMGVTLEELAELMISRGVVSAINLDGGGSTTLGVRLPGSDGVTMVNRGSDGFERSVSNSLLVFSTAPAGPLAMIAVRPDAAVVLSGSHVDFTAHGQDASYNPVRLPRPARWEVTGGAGIVDGNGRFTAGAVGDGTVKASVDEVSGSAPVNAVPSFASLEMTPSPVIVNSGASQTFTLTGRDSQGRTVFVDTAAAQWGGSPSIGRLVSAGVLRASKSGRGSLTATVGGATASSHVEIGKPPFVIEDFEDTNGLKISASRSNANFIRSTRPDPVRRGTASLQLAYDMRNHAGISAAGVQWDPPKAVESRPLRIGVWVFGDGSHHDLRGNYRDGTGAIKVVNFTTTPGSLLSTCEKRRGGIDWVGWKYIQVPIPSNAIVPIRWERIYIVEMNDRCDNASSILLDDVRAVYLDTPEDTNGPLFTNFVPAPGAVIEDGRPEIGASVKDAVSGVEPSSIRLLVDGDEVTATFDITSGRVRYTPARALLPGNHRVHLEAEDRAGNPAQPFADWGFVVR